MVGKYKFPPLDSKLFMVIPETVIYNLESIATSYNLPTSEYISCFWKIPFTFNKSYLTTQFT